MRRQLRDLTFTDRTSSAPPPRKKPAGNRRLLAFREAASFRPSCLPPRLSAVSGACTLWQALVADLVFFYGTLMSGFDRRRRADIDSKLTFVGRGTIRAALFDLGLYPAAVPAPDGEVLGELYEAIDPDAVLPVLDEIEGYRPGHPDQSLYTRDRTEVGLADGRQVAAWVYFYNAPLGHASRIASGDYLEHVTPDSRR